ncbi:MAG: DUF5024 domain-containing protein [Bacteroides sp.]|nr:DUF5024 domain-containing protein [Bacteroides sp.]
MKISSIIRSVAAMMMVLCVSYNAKAQQKIEDLMQQVMNSKDVKLIYTEQRDPSTHEIVKSSYFFTSTNPELYNKFMAAFKAERPNSIKYSEVDGSVFSITFLMDKNIKQTYSLINEAGKGWSFSTSNKNSSSSSNR